MFENTILLATLLFSKQGRPTVYNTLYYNNFPKHHNVHHNL